MNGALRIALLACAAVLSTPPFSLRAMANESPEKTPLDEVAAPSPPPPPTAPEPASAIVARPAGFAPRERGFVLETGLGLRLGTTALQDRRDTIAATVFGGRKVGRAIFGLGLQLSTWTRTSYFDGSVTSGTIVQLAVVPGVRVSMLRPANGRFELATEGDLGLGGTFGDVGVGADVQLGLPPGSRVEGSFRLFLAAGPALRYWVHPQLAVDALVLGRVDLVVFTVFDTDLRRQVDFTLVLGLRLLAVL